MGPSTNIYLDYYQFLASESYEYFSGIVTSYMAYDYEPTKDVEEEYHHYILGVQGNLWNDYVWQKDDLEYKLYPRSFLLLKSV